MTNNPPIIELAKELHQACKKFNITDITSWSDFQALIMEFLPDNMRERYKHFSQSKMLRIMKSGVEEGLFSKPHWSGIGMTPWAGSARRARMWDVI